MFNNRKAETSYVHKTLELSTCVARIRRFYSAFWTLARGEMHAGGGTPSSYYGGAGLYDRSSGNTLFSALTV